MNHPPPMVNGESSELAASLLIQGETAPLSPPRDAPAAIASSDDARKSSFYFLHTFRGDEANPTLRVPTPRVRPPLVTAVCWKLLQESSLRSIPEPGRDAGMLLEQDVSDGVWLHIRGRLGLGQL